MLLYVFFPVSFVLSLGYSEGLFITACGVCLYALSRRYWLTAALAAVVGGLTKDFGIVLIACVVVAAGHAFLRTRTARPPPCGLRGAARPRALALVLVVHRGYAVRLLTG